MMAKKFHVSFSSKSALSPSIVYISPSESHLGYFSAGILYQISSSGDFQSTAGLVKNFDFTQTLAKSEQEALQWAENWLSKKANCKASIHEVTF
jgi:hypothetical protein